MFEKEAEEYFDKNKFYSKETGTICLRNPLDAFKDGAEFGCNKAKGEIKELLKTLIKNCPDTYSGTDAVLSQKKMFRFQDTINKIELFLKEEI